ncbi:unnamed protein product [Effrenium voratum]|uniref:Uncharacterized protein n=1 Tax=Effrenium voratum TaxID=2562239 RepID=A0AA36IRP6_9DINO|nr:unnamed protein product [Effrenium voratum]
MDEAMLLEYSHLGMKAMFGIGLPALAILAPLHARATGAADDELSRISLSNATTEEWIVWVHAFFVWYVVLFILYLVWHAQRRKFRPRRSRWLASVPEPMATTLLVEGIPEQVRSEELLAKFFDEIFGKPVVRSVALVRDISRLPPLMQERDQLSERLAEACLQKRSADLPQLERQYRRAAEQLEEVAELIYSSQTFAYDAAFVTFCDRRSTEFAKRLRYSERPSSYKVTAAPPPGDVNFDSFSNSAAHINKGSALLGRLLVACMFFFFLPAVIGISSLLSVDSLSQLLPGLKDWAADHGYFTAAWEALLGTSLLCMLMDLVPMILEEVFWRFYRLRSGAKSQHKIQRWYFTFLVVFVLLVTAVGTSLFEAAARLAQAPLQVWWLLADQLPDSTNFYLRYAVLLWGAPFFDLLRCFQLLKFWRAVKVGESPEVARQMAEPEDQAFHGVGARSARWALHMVLGLTLCSLQPFIPLILAFGFMFRRLVYGYLIVFVETRKSDSGGQLWRAQMQHTQLGLVIYIMAESQAMSCKVKVMTLILMDREQSMVAAVLAGSSGSVVALFWYWYPSLLELHSLPVQQASCVEAATIGREGSSEVVAEPPGMSPYLQPELQQSLPTALRSGPNPWAELDRALATASGGDVLWVRLQDYADEFRKGYVQYGVDQTCKALARVMPSPGLRHIVEVARPGLHNLMTGLLLFFSVNLLASAVPQQAKFVLPDKLKALDPNRDGVLTGPEVEELVRNFSLKLFSVLFYLESGLFGMAALQKPKDYQAQGKDVLDKYWRELDYRKPKAVLLFLALNAAIVSTTASGCLRAWGLSPRSILALGGVGGLAFGLAAQNLVGNFMGGILLIVNRQFNVGDIIDTNGVQGKVRRMGWINIEIQSGTDLVMLPNAMVLGQKITHINRLRGATPPEP